MSLDETAARPPAGAPDDRAGGAARGEAPRGEAARCAPQGVWPIDPDPALTALPGRQAWRLGPGGAVEAEVGGARFAAGDARIAWLGVRRDAAGRPWPAAFARSPETGEPLLEPSPEPPSEVPPGPDTLDLDPDSCREIPLPAGRPALLRAGRPAGLYLFQENLGLLEAWDGAGFAAVGRLPAPEDGAPAVLGDAHGLAYAAGDRLVCAPLPQVGPALALAATSAPGLRPVSAPCRRGADLLALGVRDGRLAACRAGAGAAAALEVRDAGPAPEGEATGRFAGPWTNRLGDAFWTHAAGYLAWPAGAEPAFTAWPEGFAALSALAPWRDRADLHHQLGLVGGRYAYAPLGGPGAPRTLDGPHLAAGGVTYAGAERFDVPWQAPAEALNLGALAGALLVPLLALARDTVLLALPIEGPRAPFLRGETLPAPVLGQVLHHAHGAGLRRLPVGLGVSRLSDAGALLHAGALHLWSRGERRCHALAVRA